MDASRFGRGGAGSDEALLLRRRGRAVVVPFSTGAVVIDLVNRGGGAPPPLAFAGRLGAGVTGVVGGVCRPPCQRTREPARLLQGREQYLPTPKLEMHVR